MEIGTVINGQLLTGCNNFAGEVKFLSLPLAERVHLSMAWRFSTGFYYDP